MLAPESTPPTSCRQGVGLAQKHQGVALAVFGASGTRRCSAGRGEHWRLLSGQVRGFHGVCVCVCMRESLSESVCVCVCV